MTKKNVHIIVPDRFAEPLGGMGVGARNFIEHLSSDFDFEVIGFPEENDMKNYHGASNPLQHISHGALTTLAGQIAYTDQSTALSKPDLIHAYDWSCYLGAWYAARHFEVPLVVSMRLSVNLLAQLGIPLAMDNNTKDGFWIEKALRDMEIFGLQKADHITQVSKSYAKKFAEISGLEQKTTVVPNGIDMQKWQKKKDVVLPGNGKIKLVYIGRFVSMKGIKALCHTDIPKEIDLIFIGSDVGSEKHVLDMMLDTVAQKSNVHYVGPKYGQEKVDWLCAADAVIVPSLHEPFGIVALEALASMNILISSFVDGMSDFLTEEYAIKTHVSPQGIAQALQLLVSMEHDEKQQRIQKGLEVCKTYSWDNASRKLSDVYNSVV